MSKRTAVFVVKKSTASGPAVRNASTRAASKLLPASMAQVGPRLIGRFDDAPVSRQRGAGNPEPAAGARGSAAKARLLLDNEDVEPVMPRGDRRRHAGAAGADHQHIAFVSFLLVVRHALRLCCSFLGGHLGWDRSACQSRRDGACFPSPLVGARRAKLARGVDQSRKARLRRVRGLSTPNCVTVTVDVPVDLSWAGLCGVGLDRSAIPDARRMARDRF